MTARHQMPAAFGSSALKAYLEERTGQVDAFLDRCLPEESRNPEALHRAMRYSLFSGGKRVRPVLVIAGAEAAGGRSEDVLGVAGAIELIHTYTLIHDDLPALDDDDHRRGRLTCHKVFGEAVAILAGDALLTKAFELLAEPKEFPSVPAERLLEVAGHIARTAGSTCLVGGQVVDLESEGKQIDLPLLEYIHVNKTGALIVASVTSGARLCGAEPERLRALTRYGECIGLVFQITDDLLDVTGDREAIGRRTGGDRARGKATFPALLGISESRSRAGELTDMAIDHLAAFDERADPLRALAVHLRDRDR